MIVYGELALEEAIDLLQTHYVMNDVDHSSMHIKDRRSRAIVIGTVISLGGWTS